MMDNFTEAMAKAERILGESYEVDEYTPSQAGAAIIVICALVGFAAAVVSIIIKFAGGV
jgi:hypothetical protein